MIDLGYIHDILRDASICEAYSAEARQSALALADALQAVYENGRRQGERDAKESGA